MTYRAPPGPWDFPNKTTGGLLFQAIRGSSQPKLDLTLAADTLSSRPYKEEAIFVKSQIQRKKREGKGGERKDAHLNAKFQTAARR